MSEKGLISALPPVDLRLSGLQVPETGIGALQKPMSQYSQPTLIAPGFSAWWSEFEQGQVHVVTCHLITKVWVLL